MVEVSSRRTLVARAPTRIDFGGAWTDVPPYSLREGGCVCSVAISLYATARLTVSAGQQADVAGHPDWLLAKAAMQRAGITGVHAELVSDFPVSAGLGGSSAASVAMLGALDRWQPSETRLDRHALAEASRELEVRDLGIAGGRQDHYAAAFGGALGLWFGETTTLRHIPLSPGTTQSLARRCIVAYTGQSRISADTVTGVMSAYEQKQRGVVEALARMKDLATSMIGALERGDIGELGLLVGEHWSWQRTLHPAIPTPQIDHLLSVAMAAGAMGGKALGASGGGCVVAIAAEGEEQRVRLAMGDHAQLLDFRIDTDGFFWEISTS